MRFDRILDHIVKKDHATASNRTVYGDATLGPGPRHWVASGPNLSWAWLSHICRLGYDLGFDMSFYKMVNFRSVHHNGVFIK